MLDRPAAGRGPPADASAHACAAWLTNEVLPTPDRMHPAELVAR